MIRSGSANLRDRSPSPMRRQPRRLPTIPRASRNVSSPTRSTSDINFPQLSQSPTRRRERSLSPGGRETRPRRSHHQQQQQQLTLTNHTTATTTTPQRPQARRAVSHYDMVDWRAHADSRVALDSDTDGSDDWY